MRSASEGDWDDGDGRKEVRKIGLGYVRSLTPSSSKRRGKASRIDQWDQKVGWRGKLVTKRG